jgi:hypothetical protein
MMKARSKSSVNYNTYKSVLFTSAQILQNYESERERKRKEKLILECLCRFLAA